MIDIAGHHFNPHEISYVSPITSNGDLKNLRLYLTVILKNGKQITVYFDTSNYCHKEEEITTVPLENLMAYKDCQILRNKFVSKI